MSVLTGALTAAEVTDVPDDADTLRSAARRFSDAADGVSTAATRASRAWSGLPAVLRADALTPALTPLMDPAVQRARALQAAADDFLRVASAAADRIDDLEHEHDRLVAQIEQFQASAPGRVEAHAVQEAASGNLLGAVATVITNWQQVPALVTEEAGLRMRVRNHNEAVTSALAAIAGQLDAITPSHVAAGTVHTTAAVHHDDGNWLTHAWGTVESTAKAGWAGVEAGAEAAWPHIQDGAAIAGNVFASLGNAMTNHPDDVLELLGGLAMMAGGSAMEGGGGLLDATGIGAIGGIPLNIAGAGVIAGGATMAGAGALGLGVHAMSDDSESPFSTDHAQNDRNEPNENHPGRNKAGEFQSKDNDKARADSAQKEAAGVKRYEQITGRDAEITKVKATVDGDDHVRYYDALAKKSDDTYEGVEVKSGTASRNAQQHAFDGKVSYSNPAYAKLNGKTIEITSVREIKVK